MTIVKSEFIELASCEAESFNKVVNMLASIGNHATDPIVKEQADELFYSISDFMRNHIKTNYSK